MIDLKTLTTEELKELNNQINKELNSRNKVIIDKIIYKTDNYDDSNYHVRSGHCWAKIITDIDINKTNGYAFIGDFIKVKEENLVLVDSIIIEHDNGGFICYKATKDGKIELAKGNRRNIISFILKVNDLLKEKEKDNE